MKFEDYESWLQTFKQYPKSLAIQYCTMKLAGEAGEVAEKVAKTYRDLDGVFDYERQLAIAYELGDVLWYVTALSNEFGFTLADIARLNQTKLNGRLVRGTLKGDGDNR